MHEIERLKRQKFAGERLASTRHDIAPGTQQLIRLLSDSRVSSALKVPRVERKTVFWHSRQVNGSDAARQEVKVVWPPFHIIAALAEERLL